MAASLTLDELRSQLETLGLETRGNKADLRTRLKKAHKAQPSWARSTITGNGKEAESLQSWTPEYHSFLVLDVEATCESTRKYEPFHKRFPNTRQHVGVTSFQYPSEIIEFPVVLLRWNLETQTLETKDTFHTYVRPTFRPKLSKFCKQLTGITQSNVDSAPTWDQVVENLCQFLLQHDLLEKRIVGGEDIFAYRLKKGVTWATHGPADLREFVVKQCWIRSGPKASVHSGTPPMFLRGPLIDVRRSIASLYAWEQELKQDVARAASSRASPFPEFGGEDGFQVIPPTPKSSSAGFTHDIDLKSAKLSSYDQTLVGLLDVLTIGPFRGRQHCGMDDTINVARLVIELADRIVQASKGTQILCSSKRFEEVDGNLRPQQVTLDQVDPKKGLHRARQMEKLALSPNIQTQNVHKRWFWMGRHVGDVQWPYLPEDEE